jgi:carboxymethylenebutenolidase
MKNTQHSTEPSPVRGSWRAGETITFGGLADKGAGYMGYTERVGPSVLVLHEAYGLGPGTRSYVDRLAEEGFTALAPDLCGGQVAADLEQARALGESLDVASTLKVVRAAAAHLTENWHPRLGVVGFSIGAAFATGFVDEVERDATVAYYGYQRELVVPERWSGSLVGHLAAVDEFHPWDEACDLFAALDGAGHDVEWHRYEGTGPSFANPDVLDAFDSDASELAWERTIEALYYHLS